jgi:hypothetical protein
MIKPRRVLCPRHVACMRAKRNAYKDLIIKTRGRRPLEKPRYRWEYNIKRGWEGCGLIRMDDSKV